jgi:hypothetical protein
MPTSFILKQMTSPVHVVTDGLIMLYMSLSQYTWWQMAWSCCTCHFHYELYSIHVLISDGTCQWLLPHNKALRINTPPDPLCLSPKTIEWGQGALSLSEAVLITYQGIKDKHIPWPTLFVSKDNRMTSGDIIYHCRKQKSFCLHDGSLLMPSPDMCKHLLHPSLSTLPHGTTQLAILAVASW